MSVAKADFLSDPPVLAGQSIPEAPIYQLCLKGMVPSPLLFSLSVVYLSKWKPQEKLSSLKGTEIKYPHRAFICYHMFILEQILAPDTETAGLMAGWINEVPVSGTFVAWEDMWLDNESEDLALNL